MIAYESTPRNCGVLLPQNVEKTSKEAENSEGDF